MQQLLKELRKADKDFKLIENNDVLALGLSGGKDSMLLLRALAIYQRFNHKQFTLIAIHLDMGFSPCVDNTLQKYCDELKIPLYIEHTNIYEILKHYPKKDGSIDCSRCSSLKRGAIVALANKHLANKIAFAHHQDDAIETLFMNVIYGGKLNTFKPKITYDNHEITFIRPLIYTKEKDIQSTVHNLNIPSIKSNFPKDGSSNRAYIKSKLNELYIDFPSSNANFKSILFEENCDLWKKSQ